MNEKARNKHEKSMRDIDHELDKTILDGQYNCEVVIMESRYRKRLRKQYGGINEVLKRDAEVISDEDYNFYDLSDNVESSPFPHSEEDFSYDNVRP